MANKRLNIDAELLAGRDLFGICVIMFGGLAVFMCWGVSVSYQTGKGIFLVLAVIVFLINFYVDRFHEQHNLYPFNEIIPVFLWFSPWLILIISSNYGVLAASLSFLAVLAMLSQRFTSILGKRKLLRYLRQQHIPIMLPKYIPINRHKFDIFLKRNESKNVIILLVKCYSPVPGIWKNIEITQTFDSDYAHIPTIDGSYAQKEIGNIRVDIIKPEQQAIRKIRLIEKLVDTRAFWRQSGINFELNSYGVKSDRIEEVISSIIHAENVQ